jgi:transcriptional regulator with XRE-family HTH domain
VNKKRENAKRIKRLREQILQLNQGEFAAKIPVARSRVSEWEAAKRAPSAEHLYRLGSIAPAPEDALWFWNQAGLGEQKILAAARKIATNAEGKRTILIPRFRYVHQGREEISPPVPLPRAYIPNPRATICVSVDKESGGIADAPQGLFIVDTSVEGTESPLALLRKVIVFSFTPLHERDDTPAGIYIGRLWMQPGAWEQHGKVELVHRWSLSLLTGMDIGKWIELGERRTALPFEVPGASRPGAFNFGTLLDLIKDRNEDKVKLKETGERLCSEFRFASGHRVLGQVIGRLSGNVK